MSKTLINITNKYDRTIVLVDMDCFYCQVEEKLNPSLKGKPIAVVQYNAWKGGGIIAVNYAARDRGVTRHMRGDEAKTHCPDIELVQVPSVREKADLTKYREAGKDVAAVLQRFTTLLERASVDEAYLDITESVKKRFKEMNDGGFVLTPDKLLNCYAVGYQNIGEFIQNISNNVIHRRNIDDCNLKNDKDDEETKAYSKYDIKLLIGASIVNEIRQAVKEETGFECSAGIAHNKILAKLVCGMNKPNKQTVLPVKNVSHLYSSLPIHKIKGLGAKFGEEVCDKLKIKLMSELSTFTLADLQKYFDDKTGLWLFQMARGIDLEAVTPRFASKSIGCCKKFPGRNAIKGIATLNHWLTELSKEIFERLEKDEIENNRVAKQIVVSFTQQVDGEDVASTRCVPLNSIDVEIMAQDALDVIKKNTEVFFKTDQNTVLLNPITLLGISAGKFDDIDRQKKNTIKDMFSKATSSDSTKVSARDVKENKSEKNAIKDMFSKATSSDSTKVFAKDVKENKSENVEVPKTKNGGKNDIKSFFSAAGSNDVKHKEKESDCPTVDGCNTSNNSSRDSNVNTSTDSIPIPDTLTTDALTTDTLTTDTMESTLTIDKNEFTKVLKENVPVANNDENEPMPGTSGLNQRDYKATYAEFVCPIIPDDFYQTCTQCNQKVLFNAMQSHMDMHLAFQLSQEQRVEFRSQLKSKQSSPLVSSAKKPRLDRSTNLNVSGSSAGSSKGALNKFFMKTNEDVPKSSVKCEECGKIIAIDSVAEHSDYHAAKKLQMEINSSDTGAVSSSKSNKNGKTVKPKGGSSTASNKRSIASFFKTTN